MTKIFLVSIANRLDDSNYYKVVACPDYYTAETLKNDFNIFFQLEEWEYLQQIKVPEIEIIAWTEEDYTTSLTNLRKSNLNFQIKTY